MNNKSVLVLTMTMTVILKMAMIVTVTMMVMRVVFLKIIRNDREILFLTL